MAREDEVERVRRQPTCDPWEVAKKDSEVSLAVDKLLRLCVAERIRTWVDTDELDALLSNGERERLVPEKRNAFHSVEILRLDGLRKRVVTRGEVVVSEYGDA
jgi:hypothetical protein